MKKTIQLLLYIMLCFTSRSWATNKPFPIAYFRGQSQNFPIDYLFDKKEIKWAQDIRQVIHCHQIDFKLPLKKTQKHHCYLCNKSYKHSWSLKEHNKIHNGQGFPCSYCSQVFTRQSYQADHKRIHTGTKPFLCTDCHKSFRCKRNLVQHREIHLSKTQKSLSCPYYSKKYRYNGRPANHLTTANKSPFYSHSYTTKERIKAILENINLDGITELENIVILYDGALWEKRSNQAKKILDRIPNLELSCSDKKQIYKQKAEAYGIFLRIICDIEKENNKNKKDKSICQSWKMIEEGDWICKEQDIKKKILKKTINDSDKKISDSFQSMGDIILSESHYPQAVNKEANDPLVISSSDIIEQEKKKVDKGYEMLKVASDMYNQGKEKRRKGLSLLKGKYGNIMAGHKKNSNCYWDCWEDTFSFLDLYKDFWACHFKYIESKELILNLGS